MKKIITLSVLMLLLCNAQAQLRRPEKIRETPVAQDTMVAKTKQPIKTLPKGIKAEPPKADSTPVKPADNTAYYLATVKVDIVTGNDNKEKLSKISIGLVRPGGSYFGNGIAGIFETYAGNTFEKQEFKTNSTNQFILKTDYQMPWTFPGGVSEGWRYEERELNKIQNYGLELYISYRPNFVLDAWKIEKVTMTLEFKDISGKPHPTLSTVVIPFVASPLLKDGNVTLKCVVDKFLLPRS